MEKLQKGIVWTILLSETTHVFCCVLPTLFSVLSLLAGIGMFTMPAGLFAFHEFMHEWELPIIIFSAVVLLLGWGLYRLSVKIDCHNTGCAHGPCGTKKRNASGVLKIATLLFLANTAVYLIFHAKGDF